MKKTYLYPIKIETCKEGGFLASCPSVQGCYAEGRTINEAVSNLKDVIKTVLEFHYHNSKSLPGNFASVERQQVAGELNLAITR